MSGFEQPDDLVGQLPPGWSEKNGGECRSCRAPLRWARNDQSGKMSPFNLDGTSHFATCPDAATFRTQRDAGGGPKGGAAAAVAVVEAARRVCATWKEHPRRLDVSDLIDLGELDEAVRAFDVAVGVSR